MPLVADLPIPAPTWTPSTRACSLCLQSQTVGGQLHCFEPGVAGLRRSVPVIEARSERGGCGPEARFLDFTGLHG